MEKLSFRATREETENLPWRLAPEIEVGGKCSHEHRNQYLGGKIERKNRTSLFYGLGTGCNIYLENCQRRENVTSCNTVVIMFRQRRGLPCSPSVTIVTVTALTVPGSKECINFMETETTSGISKGSSSGFLP